MPTTKMSRPAVCLSTVCLDTVSEQGSFAATENQARRSAHYFCKTTIKKQSYCSCNPGFRGVLSSQQKIIAAWRCIAFADLKTKGAGCVCFALQFLSHSDPSRTEEGPALRFLKVTSQPDGLFYCHRLFVLSEHAGEQCAEGCANFARALHSSKSCTLNLDLCQMLHMCLLTLE